MSGSHGYRCRWSFVTRGVNHYSTVSCRRTPTSPPVTKPPPAERPVLPSTYRPSGHMATGDVAVQLFEWSWTDVAAECENALGPLGYRAALISPPQEHAVLDGGPWWEHYQPVSYGVAHNTFGTGTQFDDMWRRCRA